MTIDNGLGPARDAVARGEWSHALDLLAEWPDGDDRAEVLELQAQAAYGAGEFESAVQAWEDLHTHELARGDSVAAARAAAMVAMYLMMDTGLMAPVRGWLRTAERLLDGAADNPAHALIAMTRTYERFMCGDMDGAREWSARAVEIGAATGTTPAVVIGRTCGARVRIFDGDLEGGLEQLEEVGALLMAGGADPLTTGMMYCEIICAAQGLGLHDVASEWTRIMETWRHGAAVGGINGRCRVHRAEVLRVAGPCDAAEAEALGACAELRPWMRREFGWPLAELGNIRLRRGDLAGAEEALNEAHQHAWSPQPGLALVRLGQGDVDTAAAMIADAIERPVDIPSKERPPFGDLRLAPLLDAQAEIAFARHDAETAARAAASLESITTRFPGPFLHGWASLALGRAALLAGDADAAIAHCDDAITRFCDLGAPYEAATARLVLGAAHEQAGHPDAARLEWNTARTGFEQYGAGLRAREADDLAAGSGRSPTATTTRPDDVVVGFVSDGSTRIVRFAGRSTPMRDLKGLRYVARLAADPGREFHVLDLVAADAGVLRPVGHAEPVPGSSSRGGDPGMPVLDDAARDAYRRRLAEIDDDIEEAGRNNDLGRLDLAEHDREYLVAELARAVGLGGRARTVGGTAERARTSVARSIRYALERLDEVQPELTLRLRATIATGTYCCYRPDPVAPLEWRF